MKVGSLVECICNNVENPAWVGILPVIGETYTIREIFEYEGDTLCYVEEIVSDIADDGHEYAHDIRWYREVQPPMNVKALMEECIYEPA
jgi:hypothetical protein